MHKKEFFPDGSPIDDWFYDISVPEYDKELKKYALTDYNIFFDV